VGVAATLKTRRKPRSDGQRSRETILRAAASLATIHGLEGISIGALAAHIGMSKSGLYAHFGSKEELQLATVETALEIFDAEVVEPTAGIDDPLERLRALCASFFSHLERRVFQGGCFFASVEAEFDTHPGPVRDRIAVIQRGWSMRLQQLVAEAQKSGELREDEDPAQLAFELDAYMLMGNTSFFLHDDPAFLRRAGEAVDRRLASAARPER
jgi:AcrR family transcriptional regulator